MQNEYRLMEILSILSGQNLVTVEELEKSLYVSASTIRRDLQKLQKRGLIVRCSGGALTLSSGAAQTSAYAQQDGANADEALAAYAVKLLPKEGTVFLLASPLVSAMAPYLYHRAGLTIVTNSVDVALALAGAQPTVYLTGGTYDAKTRSVLGAQATETAAHFCYDVVLFSSGEVTAAGALVFSDFRAVHLLQVVLSNSKQNVLVYDPAAPNQAYRCIYPLMPEVDTVLSTAPPAFKTYHAETICMA